MYRAHLTEMTLQRYVVTTLLIATASFSNLTNASEAPWHISETPSWVEPVEPWSTPSTVDGEFGGGIEMRLYERQHQRMSTKKAGTYVAYEYLLANRIGVEDYSNVDISFDPIYQTLQLHELSILRSGSIIDKLPDMRANLLQRERELESLLFDGEQTLNLIVSDVRVGDVLRVAYTREGSNPIFGSLFETTTMTERSYSSLGRYRTRLIVDADENVVVRKHGRAAKHISRHVNGQQEIIVDELDLAVLEEDDDVHPRFYNLGAIVFSNIEEWQTIVDWALPLYQIDDQIPEELQRVANDIKVAHQSEAEQIGAALHWVQDEIRYFGVELGADSHLPARPQQTLQRRFGDCKGKTLLLMSLLDALGVDSNAALVDSTEDLSSPGYPWLLHAFDHVIVHLELDGESHWLDPTRTYQRGAVGEFHEPDYGQALIVARGVNELTPMHNRLSKRTMTIENLLVLPADETQAAELTVNTTRTGRLAESFRRDQESDTIRELGERYTKFYGDQYGDVEQAASPVRTDHPDNRFQTEERYRLKSFWRTKGGEKQRWLWGNDLESWIDDDPNTSARTQPLSQSHPVEILENWTIKMSRPHQLDALDSQIENRWFTLAKTHVLSPDGLELSVSMRYTSLTDHVLASDLDEYAKQLEEADDSAAFLIFHSAPEGDWLEKIKKAFEEAYEEESTAQSDVGTLVQKAELGGVGLGALIAGIVVLRRRLKRS